MSSNSEEKTLENERTKLLKKLSDCGRVPLDGVQCIKNCTFKNPFPAWFIFAVCLQVPGSILSIVMLFFNPCIPRDTVLFWSVFSLYLVICLIVFYRGVSYALTIVYCSHIMGRYHIRLWVCMTMLQGLFMNIYLLYTWSHNYIALAGSILCSCIFYMFYIGTFIEKHLRFCDNKVHELPTTCSTKFQVVYCQDLWVDILLFIIIAIFYILIFVYDGDLNFNNRATSPCDPY
jgi:hypothetical protein